MRLKQPILNQTLIPGDDGRQIGHHRTEHVWAGKKIRIGIVILGGTSAGVWHGWRGSRISRSRQLQSTNADMPIVRRFKMKTIAIMTVAGLAAAASAQSISVD
ncbi:MAG: hypothetical protein K8E66_10930, partial [Phycisphaerales bacterium]|nr:hypothetical protein [Phycisphaerales bacterium]